MPTQQQEPLFLKEFKEEYNWRSRPGYRSSQRDGLHAASLLTLKFNKAVLKATANGKHPDGLSVHDEIVALRDLTDKAVTSSPNDIRGLISDTVQRIARSSKDEIKLTEEELSFLIELDRATKEQCRSDYQTVFVSRGARALTDPDEIARIEREIEVLVNAQRSKEGAAASGECKA